MSINRRDLSIYLYRWLVTAGSSYLWINDFMNQMLSLPVRTSHIRRLAYSHHELLPWARTWLDNCQTQKPVELTMCSGIHDFSMLCLPWIWNLNDHDAWPKIFRIVNHHPQLSESRSGEDSYIVTMNTVMTSNVWLYDTMTYWLDQDFYTQDSTAITSIKDGIINRHTWRYLSRYTLDQRSEARNQSHIFNRIPYQIYP